MFKILTIKKYKEITSIIVDNRQRIESLEFENRKLREDLQEKKTETPKYFGQ